jgi:hypothetical protein
MLRRAIGILLLAAEVCAQQVGVPAGGTLGPSSNLSDGATLNSDRLDGKHGSDFASWRKAGDIVSGGLAGGRCLHTSADGTQILETSADCGTGAAQADWAASSGPSQILNKPALAAVATSGSYNDLSNKPAIPAAQVNSDWNAAAGAALILNKPASFPPSAHTHGAADTVSGARAGGRCLHTSADGTQMLEAAADCGSGSDMTALTTDVLTSAAGSTSAAPRTFGVSSGMGTGNATRMALDSNNGVQNGYGKRLTLYSYNGLEIQGNRRGGPPDIPAAAAASASDPGLSVVGTAAGAPVMRVTGASGQTGDLLQVQNNDGSNVFRLDKDGNAVFGTGSGGTVTASADMVDGLHGNQLMTGVWSDIVNWSNGGVQYYGYWTPSRAITLKWIEVRAQLAGSGGTCASTPQISIYQNAAQVAGPVNVPIDGSYAKLALNVNVSSLSNPLALRLVRADDCTNHTQFIHTSVTYEMNQ